MKRLLQRRLSRGFALRVRILRLHHEGFRTSSVNRLSPSTSVGSMK